VTRVLGLELIVGDIDRAVALFTDVFGFELHERGSSELISGHVAVVTDGRVGITLLQPTTDGDGKILPDRAARLSQVVLGSPEESIDHQTALAIEAGLAISPTADGFYLTPESVGGALGLETAIVVVPSRPDE